ncbi:hypothetical protein PVAND_013545 [Polypedilum vanderplanki]|uniref:G-protein coupled receptors family 3 profile domain-containing protein n=1 Tax=Polypedilum vanderplanki TaxID=319348 RepID=A0A9J6CRQ7_POLVA|nr:hypothetical protein PVAND_013545 [Polypedilum vanderplanki]
MNTLNEHSCASKKVRELYGIQRVEVIFQTIDKINKDPELLKNIKLGVEIRDTCWYAPIALQQTIELIRDSILPYQSKSSFPQCSNTSIVENHNHENDETLIGIVGPASSSIALQVQNLLQLFSIPQIGYSTTSKDLSDKTRYSTFMRVVPSDYFQAQVMVDIVKFNNWSYIHTVHTDENYGQSGIQAFRELADKNNICIAKEDSILSTDDDEKFQELIKNLEQDEKAHVIVCFCEGLTVRKLLIAIKNLNLTNNFIIIGSDGMADRQDVVIDYEEQAVGSISIRIHSPYLHSFDEKYFNLDPFENSRNPWFREFWEDKFHCKMPVKRIITTTSTTTEYPDFNNETETEQGNQASIALLPLTAAQQQTPFCTGYESLRKNHKQEPKLSFLVNAIYVYAYALEAYSHDVCGRDGGACNALKKSFNHSTFFNYLMNVSFTTPHNDIVEFNQDGDASARYDIMNFQMKEDGSYDYVQIGNWINHTLNFFKPIQSPPNGIVKSVCSDPCQPGYYKIQDTPEQQFCCFNCAPCDDNQYLKNETHCEDCKEGWWPNSDKTECLQNSIDTLKWTDTESVISISFSAFGTILTLMVLSIFINFNNTPVVKASTRELCYIVLAGCILSHLSIFSILAHPTNQMCALSRTLPGISFSMIYGSLLIKTNRISRLLAISKKHFPTKKLKFMSPLSQVVLAFLLISIESFIAIGMLIIEQPVTQFKYPGGNLQTLLVCKESPLTILVPLAFIFVLIILCVFYAVKTRSVPENFNETKFVGFAIYTTCIIWLAFFPIYYGSEMQIITKCLCISLSSIMTLVFMFFPKVYIILFHPEKNIRALFTTSKSIRCHIGATRHSNISKKTSSSMSSMHGPPSGEFDSGFQPQRSFKKSSYSQTSIEKLNIQKVDSSSSPIKNEIFEHFIPEQRVTFYQGDDDRKYYDYKKIPTSPSHNKIKKNKIHMKDMNGPSTKNKSKHKSKRNHANNANTKNQEPIYCAECLEMERQNHQPPLYQQLNHINENEQLITTKMSTKSQIFTVEKIPLNTLENNEKKRIAISEESLSECSISDTACKLKRITIKLK